MTPDLFHRKGQNKVQFDWKYRDNAWLWVYFIENDEIRSGWGFILLKKPKQGMAQASLNILKVWLGISSIGKTKIMHGWGFVSWKLLKKDTAGDLFYWKGHDKLWLRIYSI